MNIHKENPTVDNYVTLEKEWHLRGISIDTATKKEALFFKSLRESVCASTDLTSNELLLIAQCRIFKLSHEVFKFARLLTKQQKEKTEMFANSLNLQT